MKKFQKMLSVITLATILATTSAITAFASNGTITDGSITFTTSEDPNPIDPPTDPTDPKKNDWDKIINAKKLYFGSNELSAVEKTYESKVFDDNESGDTITGRYTGVVSQNNTTGVNTVKVKISNFTQDGTTPVMEGFQLTLTPDTSTLVTENEDPVYTPSTKTLTAGAVADTILTVGSLEKVGLMWTGDLNVLGRTNVEGDSQAVITWESILAE